MIDCTDDEYEKTIYVIEVHNKGEPRDEYPLFYMSFVEKECQLDPNEYVLTPINYIRKTPVLSKCRHYTNQNFLYEDIGRLEELGLQCYIRKVYVELQPEKS
jgi:hypothetical protein